MKYRVLLSLVAFGLLVGISIFVLSRPAGMSMPHYIRKEMPAVFPLIRRMVWELDEEIPAERPGLPLVELNFSRRDIAHFDDLYSKYQNPEFGQSYYTQHNRWRNAEMRYGGKKYKIKIRSQAGSPTSHRKDQFISYTVKLRNRKAIDGVVRFNLVIREKVQPERHYNIALAKHFNLIYQDLKLIRLQINGWEEKLYYWEDKLDSPFMEARHNSSLIFFRSKNTGQTTSDKAMMFPGQMTQAKYGQYLSATFKNIFDDDGAPSALSDAVLERYEDINEAIISGQAQSLDRFFDLEYISSFEAVRLLLGLTGHGFQKGNLRMAFNYSNGKYYPAIIRDNVSSSIPARSLDEFERKQSRFGGREIPLMSALSRNDIIRQMKYRKAYRFLKENPKFSTRLKEISEYHERTHYRGWFTQVLRQLNLIKYTDVLNGNGDRIVKFLENSNPQVNYYYSNSNLILEVRPHSFASLRIGAIEFDEAQDAWSGRAGESVLSEHRAGQLRRVGPIPFRTQALAGVDVLELADSARQFFTALSMDLQAEDNVFFLKIPIQNLRAGSPKPTKVTFSNSVTGAKISVIPKRIEDSRLSLVEDVGQGESTDKLSVLQKQFPSFQLHLNEAGQVVLAPGQHTLTRDFELPPGLDLVIEAGTVLRLDAGVSIVGTGGLFVLGTPEQPVLIEALQQDAPFGTIGFTGNGKTDVRIEHLSVSGGNEAWKNGTYFSGELSLYNHADVFLRHVTVTDSISDDGLNVKFAKNLSIDESRFFGNYADQVDLDYVSGVVKNVRFESRSGNDLNGDGLDASGSSLLVKDSTFSGFADKGISFGEETKAVVQDSTFRKNRRGIAVKDGSQVVLMGNIYDGNKVDLSLYRKKKMFSGGLVFAESQVLKQLQVRSGRASRVIGMGSEELLEESSRMRMEGTRRSAFVGATLEGN